MRDMDALSATNYRRLSELIYDQCGIHLAAEKQSLLESRLRKRLRSLSMASTAEYCSYVLASGGRAEELPHLIDVVTTNKTDFFRESQHFDFLIRTALPSLESSRGAGTGQGVLLWSAGCSTGEEPYTLAMVLTEHAERNSRFQFRLLATDISTVVLEQARRAVFRSELVQPIPADLRRKYLLRSKDTQKRLYRVVPELRDKVEFRRLNLMDGDFGIGEPVDIIFCRNVIIYFDPPTRARLLQKFTRQLRPGGYLFLGHSETLHGLDVPLTPAGPTVYRKPDAATRG
jgi:chemotaxis protein methyltransferase CheR